MRGKIIVRTAIFAMLGILFLGFSACASSQEPRDLYALPREIRTGFY